ncbi:hypothetical protein TSUD_393230 [Trifolium subterraneum]|uniref:HMA domain-containing protein n=1 Tax=Trifolium subterraneum TaxID=3900 RepID=A0A2Z6MQV9_TRISU|nr:hypothetical protein TSUD_393230 [Trifolium subterraneum]
MDPQPKPPSPQPLKYQTWFLKVSIHCEGCKNKVKKVLKRIDGVFTATIDSQQQKVTVTGNVAVETLLRKLVKAGKHAEIWPENINGKGKSSGKEKKKDKNEPKEPQSLQNKGTESVAKKCENVGKNKNKKSNSGTGESPEKLPAGDNVPPVSGGGGGSAKKKKKKDGCGGGNGNESSNGLSTVAKSGPAHTGFQFQNPGQGMAHQMNLSPTRQQSFLYSSETGYPPMAYISSAYHRLYPMGRVCDPSYYVPSTPYTCPPSLVDQYHYGAYQLQSGPLVPFEYFSDENTNGCSIM